MIPDLKRKPTDAELATLQAQKALAKRIKAAAASGNIAEARAAVAEGQSLERADHPKGVDPLAIAARAGQAEFLRWGLGELFGDPSTWKPDLKDARRDAAVRRCAAGAVATGQIAVLDELLRFGAQLGLPLLDDSTAADLAIANDQPALFAACAHHWVPKAGECPIHKAIALAGFPMPREWADAIVAAVARMDPSVLRLQSWGGRNPIALCALRGHAGLIEKLAALGPDPASCGIDDEDGPASMTPLMLACAHPECVRTLLALGADESKLCSRRWSAARHALAKRNAESCRLLMDSKPGSWLQDGGEGGALWDAVALLGSPLLPLDAAGCELLERMILEAPPEILANEATSGQYDGPFNAGPLSLAAALIGKGARGCLDALLSRGADINAPSSDGTPPLCQALRLWRRGDEPSARLGSEMIEFAISRGADPTRADSRGRDLLAHAVEARFGSPMLLAIESNIDMRARRRAGWSTMAEMALRDCDDAEDIRRMAASGSQAEEVADWMQAIGAARGKNNFKLASCLLRHASVAREKWEIADASASGSASPRAPRL